MPNQRVFQVPLPREEIARRVQERIDTDALIPFKGTGRPILGTVRPDRIVLRARSGAFNNFMSPRLIVQLESVGDGTVLRTHRALHPFSKFFIIATHAIMIAGMLGWARMRPGNSVAGMLAVFWLFIGVGWGLAHEDRKSLEGFEREMFGAPVP